MLAGTWGDASSTLTCTPTGMYVFSTYTVAVHIPYVTYVHTQYVDSSCKQSSAFAEQTHHFWSAAQEAALIAAPVLQGWGLQTMRQCAYRCHACSRGGTSCSVKVPAPPTKVHAAPALRNGCRTLVSNNDQHSTIWLESASISTYL
jgi:hypothetical protein